MHPRASLGLSVVSSVVVAVELFGVVALQLVRDLEEEVGQLRRGLVGEVEGDGDEWRGLSACASAASAPHRSAASSRPEPSRESRSRPRRRRSAACRVSAVRRRRGLVATQRAGETGRLDCGEVTVGDLTAQTVVVRRLVKPALQRNEESAPTRFTQAHGRAVGLDLALPQHAGIEHPQHRGLRDAGSRGLEEIEGERGASVTKSVQEAGEDVEPCGRERYAEGAGPDVGGRNSNGNDAASAGLRRSRDGIVKRICIDKDVRRTENVARSAAGTPRSRLRLAGVVRGAASRGLRALVPSGADVPSSGCAPRRAAIRSMASTTQQAGTFPARIRTSAPS